VAASPSTGAAPGAAPAGPDAGLVTIESDSQQADNRTGVVTATGNVRITYPDRRMVATSRQAQYYSKEGRLVLTGDVDVIDEDGQRIRAERLVYRLDSERLVAEPRSGKQVYSRLRLQPAQPGGTSAPAAPAPTLLP
jgi:lipopolysaccharide export system protein LptA